MKEYLDVLDDAAFGAASSVERRASSIEPKFPFHSDPSSQWTVARKGPFAIVARTNAGRTDFEWDLENDQYICSDGAPLKQFRRNYSNPNRGPTGKGVAKYQALKHTCRACPSKMRRCPNADARKITGKEHEDARQVAREIA